MTKELLRYQITFLRHGESVGNAEGRLQGQSDFPLSKLGKAQARALARRWQAENVTFDRVITSTLTRAVQTAEIISSMLSVDMEADPLWVERNNGKISGLRQAEVKTLYPNDDSWGLYDNFAEDGEGDWELYLRAGRALHKLMRRPAGNYLVVSHGGTLNQTMYALMGIAPHPRFQGARFRFDNTGFCLTTYDPVSHTWRILGMNDHTHIKNLKLGEITDE
jgi:broad specificity phosphatase PhoE